MENLTTIKYLGERPLHFLKLDWSSGMEVSLVSLFKTLSNKCTCTDKFDIRFVEWFRKEYLSRNNEFVINLGKDLAADSVEELVEEEWDDSDQKVILESSKVETATSFREAEDRLRKMRHPDVVGNIASGEVEMKTNTTTVEYIQSLPKPGSSVITGDDLAASNSISGKNQRSEKNPSGLMFDGNGDVIKVMPSSREEQEKVNAQLANLSGKVKVMTLNNLDDSRIISGDNLSNGLEPEVTIQEIENVRKVNKNFKAFKSGESKREILPNHIVDAETDQEAIKLIKKCNNSTTLKVARIYLQDRGNHKLVEEIEEQLRAIPPGQ